LSDDGKREPRIGAQGHKIMVEEEKTPTVVDKDRVVRFEQPRRKGGESPIMDPSK